MKNAIAITKSEIEWHKQNTDQAPSYSEAEFFIRGMEHLLSLFEEIQSMEEE